MSYLHIKWLRKFDINGSKMDKFSTLFAAQLEPGTFSRCKFCTSASIVQRKRSD